MSRFALIDTVTPSPIIKRLSFEGAPPELPAAKGLRWIPDNPPAFSPATQALQDPAAVPVDAEEVPYTVIVNPSYEARLFQSNEDALVRRRVDELRATGQIASRLEALEILYSKGLKL